MKLQLFGSKVRFCHNAFVQRFVCESFRAGESLEGPSYVLMAVSK